MDERVVLTLVCSICQTVLHQESLECSAELLGYKGERAPSSSIVSPMQSVAKYLIGQHLGSSEI